MANGIPAFGARVGGQNYLLRPGAYAVILDDRGRVATVRVRQHVFLPGGGQHSGEPPEQAAIREVREECGFDIELLDVVGVADEFVYAEDERTYFQKRGTFFRARAVGTTEGPVEPDHEVVWLSRDEARTRLSQGSHRWALERALSG